MRWSTKIKSQLQSLDSARWPVRVLLVCGVACLVASASYSALAPYVHSSNPPTLCKQQAQFDITTPDLVGTYNILSSPRIKADRPVTVMGHVDDASRGCYVGVLVRDEADGNYRRVVGLSATTALDGAFSFTIVGLTTQVRSLDVEVEIVTGDAQCKAWLKSVTIGFRAPIPAPCVVVGRQPVQFRYVTNRHAKRW